MQELSQEGRVICLWGPWFSSARALAPCPLAQTHLSSRTGRSWWNADKQLALTLVLLFLLSFFHWIFSDCFLFKISSSSESAWPSSWGQGQCVVDSHRCPHGVLPVSTGRFFACVLVRIHSLLDALFGWPLFFPVWHSEPQKFSASSSGLWTSVTSSDLDCVLCVVGSGQS